MALKPSLQREGERSVTNKEHLADASTKDPSSSWAALLGWEGAQLLQPHRPPSSYQKSSASPKPGKSVQGLQILPPLGGYLNPKLEMPVREDRWVCQPLELPICFPKPVSCKILRSNKWAGKWESLFLPVLDVFPFKEGGG